MSTARVPRWPVAALAAGVGLLALAPLILWLTPAQTFWTDADQQRLQRASADLHAATFQIAEQKRSPQGNFHAGDGAPHSPVAAKARLEAAQTEFDRERSRLQAARSRQSWLVWSLRLAGTVVALLGFFGYVRSRGRS